MITAQSFIIDSLRALHEDWSRAVTGLTVEQVHHHAGGLTNSIAFLVWHYVRTEDNLVQFIFRGRKPTIWMSEGWDRRFELDARVQGTGFSSEDAQHVRIGDLDSFGEYTSAVFRSTEAYAETLTDEEMARIVTVRPLGELSIGGVIRKSIVTHGFSHLGEIWVLRGLQGLQGASF